ncbi:Hsp20/alpha crystallin family protein [Spirulina major CS-329]|jgi:HSP20 family protein|uniref:Hsp20/alpha crystallin family protein n=1 Tax=Spirulina TaxID=1154 RepID=UPI00232F1856|nr:MULTISPECIES: Hsp20/alpha crystallin family protein [Spirulina]MDB9494876.1 Hsp20/alpha crystallin family protein [Spirulina subsalsa CS-330]MDB9504103.1 Hsp20/alpha crystallin family protein [Spirulina major CS-329]
MALIRWQPFSEIDTLRRQMDHLFDEVANTTLSETVAWKPAVELKDHDEKLILRVQLPGINAEDVDINVTRDGVSIAGQYRDTKETDSGHGVYHSEFRYGQFKRVISLPVPIQNDRVTADFNNGVLVLDLPKVDEAVNRVVNVKLGKPQGE